MKNERRDKVLSLEYGSNISSPLARLKGASTSDELYQSQKYPQTTHSNNLKQNQQPSLTPQRCSSSQLSRIINSTTFQLIIMIMIPELFLILISIALAQANLYYSADSVSSFSLNLYEQSIYFVKLQDAAVQMSLSSQMQNEAVLLQIMHSLQYKALRGNIQFNPAFQKPVLNIDSTHANIGDPYLLQLFRKNLTLLISSWHQKDALEVTQLDSFSQAQIDLTSRIDFILRSALRTNRLEITVNPYAFLVFQYFYPFGHDGMYFSTGGTNMTFTTFVDLKPCTGGKYNLDLRCRPYYLATKNKDILTVFPPMVFYGGTDSLPYTSSGICKRQAVPLSMLDEFQVSSLNNGVYSLVCNSIRLEQISLLFERFQSDPRVLIMLLEPVSMRLVYSSSIKMKQGEVLTLQSAYLSNLDSLADQEYFLEQIKSYAAARMTSFCYSEGQETIDNQEDISFHFKQKSGEIVVFINHISSSDISQVHADDVYGENSPITTLDSGILNPTDNNTESTSKRRRCISSYWMFLTVIPKDQLLEESHFLEEKMDTINTIFQSITYVALIVSVLLFSLYLKKMSYMMNAPITHLTKILKEMNVYEAVSAANHLCEEESYNLFYSSDARVLFESFRRLFDTLGFATLSMFGENQCQTLLNLNKQILHFKQLRNYRALGVCYNNIGNVHYNNRRYVEGLESYQTAIIYIQYELQVYQEIPDAGEKKRTSLSSNKIKFKGMFQGIRQIKQYFFETQQSVTSNVTKDLSQNIGQIFNESELQELYWILYNRKLNYMKSLIGLMAEGRLVIDWEAVKRLADELQDISRNKLQFCPKRQILINHSEILIHYQTKDIQNCMRLLTENKFLLQSMQLNKAMLAKKIKTKKKIKQRSPKDSILNSSITNPKIDEIKNDLTANQSFSYSNNNNNNNNGSLGGNINIFVKQRNSIFGDGSSATTKKSYTQKNLGNPMQSPQIRGTSHSNSDPKTNSINMLLGEKNDHSALSKSNLNNYQTSLLEEASFFLGKQQSNFNSGQNLMGSPSITPKNEEIDSPQRSKPYDKTTQVTNLLPDKSSPKSKKKDQLENGKFIKSLFIRRDQTKSDNHSHNLDPIYQGNQKKQRKSKLSAIKVSESLRNINISYQSPSQGNNESQQLDSSQASLYYDGLAKSNNLNQIEASLFSVQSQKKVNRLLQDSTQLEQKKQKKPIEQRIYLEIVDSLFAGVVCEEEGTVLLLKGKKYHSANVFTAFFEETRHVLHFLQSQVFNKLSFIFSEVGLRDNELERLAFNYEFDASFKIAVFVFAPSQTLEDEKALEKSELQGERAKQQQQLQVQHQSMQLGPNGESKREIVQDVILFSEKEEIENKKQFENVISQLCTDIADKVLSKPDDMLGVIVATDPWKIEQKIEMLSSKFFKQNSGFLELAMQNLISNEHGCLDSLKEHPTLVNKGDVSNFANDLDNKSKQIDQLGNISKQRIQKQGIEGVLEKKEQTNGLSVVISPENDLQYSPSLVLETFGTQQYPQKEKVSTKTSGKRKLCQNLEQKTELSFEEKKDFFSQKGQKNKGSTLQRSLSVVSERRKYSETKSNSDGQSSNCVNFQLKIEKPSNNLKQVECKEMLLLPDESQQKSDNEYQQEEGEIEEELDSEAQMSSTQKQKNTNEINTLDNKTIKDNDELLLSSEGSTIRDQIISSSQSNKTKFMKFLERSKSQDGLKYYNQASSKEITLSSFQDVVTNGIGNRFEQMAKPEKLKDQNTEKSQGQLAKQLRILLVSKTLSKPLMKNLDKDTRSILEISRGSSCSKSVSESSQIFFSSDSSNQSQLTSPSQSSSCRQQKAQTFQDLRVLFLMGVRRALQSVLQCGGESSRIDSLMKISEIKRNQGNELEMLRKTRKLNHFLLHKKQSKQIFKKFAVVLTNSICFIKPNDSVLIFLYKQFMRFSAQLYILCLNKEQAIQFQQQIPVQYIDIVIVFISEESLIEHLLFSRSSTSFHFYPITVEHF